LKALRGQVFRIESLLPAYGALYDKLPIHAYVWQAEHGDLPVDTLQLWNYCRKLCHLCAPTEEMPSLPREL
jgi:hypothetical protein